MSASTRGMNATLADLKLAQGRAELVAGRIVMLPLLGHEPGRAAGEILMSLDDHVRATGRGQVFMSKLAYAVPILDSGRESFSPNASYYDGPSPDDPWDFIRNPPTFAVEIRSADDCGAAVDRERVAKRLDYFAAGTRAVWDVDARNELVHAYRADAPDRAVTFERGRWPMPSRRCPDGE